MSFGPAALRTRARVLRGVPVTLWMWRMLPLAAFAGLRITRLDEEACTVRLPGGWRDAEPVRLRLLRRAGHGSRDVDGRAGSRAAGRRHASGLDADPGPARELRPTPDRTRQLHLRRRGPDCRAAIARAAASDEPQVLLTRSTGTDATGEVVAEFEVDWSFKRKLSATA